MITLIDNELKLIKGGDLSSLLTEVIPAVVGLAIFSVNVPFKDAVSSTKVTEGKIAAT